MRAIDTTGPYYFLSLSVFSLNDRWKIDKLFKDILYAGHKICTRSTTLRRLRWLCTISMVSWSSLLYLYICALSSRQGTILYVQSIIMSKCVKISFLTECSLLYSGCIESVCARLTISRLPLFYRYRRAGELRKGTAFDDACARSHHAKSAEPVSIRPPHTAKRCKYVCRFDIDTVRILPVDAQ